MTTLVVRKLINGRTLKLKLVPVMRKVIGGGVLKLDRVQVICPACGQQVEAVGADGRVKGYCGVANQYVDFPVTQGIAVPMSPQASTADTEAHIGRHLTAEGRARISAARTGKHHTAETKIKIATAETGRHPTAEARAKMSATRTGRHLTAETKAKISAAITRWHNRKGEGKL